MENPVRKPEMKGYKCIIFNRIAITKQKVDAINNIFIFIIFEVKILNSFQSDLPLVGVFTDHSLKL